MKLFLCSLAAVLALTGCSSKDPEVAKEDVVKYKTFESAVVLNSTKVLIDSKFQNPFKSEIDSLGHFVPLVQGEVELYKTEIFYKDKNYVLFLSSELKKGSTLEFIFKDGVFTNLTAVK